jgi:hypothetical protein
MNTYAINICVDTKTTDIYDKVAINKFPILILAKNESNLIEMLKCDNIKDFIKNHVSKQLYENASYYIRFIKQNENVKEENNLILRIRDYTVIEYD